MSRSVSHLFITQPNFHWFKTQIHKCHGLKTLAKNSKKITQDHAQSFNEIKTEKVVQPHKILPHFREKNIFYARHFLGLI